MTLGDLLTASRNSRAAKVAADAAAVAADAQAQHDDAAFAAALQKLNAVAIDTSATPPVEYSTPDGQTISTRPTADLTQNVG